MSIRRQPDCKTYLPSPMCCSAPDTQLSFPPPSRPPPSPPPATSLPPSPLPLTPPPQDLPPLTPPPRTLPPLTLPPTSPLLQPPPSLPVSPPPRCRCIHSTHQQIYEPSIHRAVVLCLARLEGRGHIRALTTTAYQRFVVFLNASLLLSCHGTLMQRSSCAATVGARLQECNTTAGCYDTTAAIAAGAGVLPEDAVQGEGRPSWPRKGVQTPDTVSTLLSSSVFRQDVCMYSETIQSSRCCCIYSSRCCPVCRDKILQYFNLSAPALASLLA